MFGILLQVYVCIGLVSHSVLFTNIVLPQPPANTPANTGLCCSYRCSLLMTFSQYYSVQTCLSNMSLLANTFLTVLFADILMQ